MMRSLFSAVSGLKNHQTAMDVIGNNVANVNTTGYKTSRVIFQDIYSQTLSSATAPTTTTGGVNAKQVGLGVTVSSIGMNMTEGSTQSTSYALDFAISGEGFFVINDGSGTYSYTRNGALGLDAEGYLVDTNGNYVMAMVVGSIASGGSETITAADLVNGSPIDVDGDGLQDFTKIQLLGVISSVSGVTKEYTDYAVDKNGMVTATLTTTDLTDPTDPKITTSTETVGRLVLATFNNAAGLEKQGSSYYHESANSGEVSFKMTNDLGAGYLKAGSLEMSNVDLATELTSMIVTQRGFQANSRVITTSDTMLEELINLKR
ncbi:Flagellar basal-body rod protein FlgG [bioreactor metagenome]|uniref:Flagellar basal-body rod protein FlgG n=1 Tax=bioreactor metagenome TaxID=1076179 RepID=A0A644XND5_9ZZZZ